MVKSTLHPTNQSLVLPLVASLFGHGFALGGFAFTTMLLTFCGPSKPIIDPDDSIEVAMLVLPRSASSLPDRATRAPEVRGAPTPEPAPAPDVKHTSDLVHETERAPENAGNDGRRLEDAQDDLLKQLEMEDALAALGDENQGATDPNSDVDEGASTASSGVVGDPELAKYLDRLQKLFNADFHPLESITAANPGIQCIIRVHVEPATGRVLSSDIKKPSGVAAYDAAAQRAVDAITMIPLPPERFRDRMAQGYDIRF